MGAPRMTQADYETYLARMSMMHGKAAKTPLPCVGTKKASKWTEAERSYFHGVLNGVGEYEGAELRITPDGCEEHHYTPDFVTEHDDTVTACGHSVKTHVTVYHEVKGNYRLGSQDAARLRWTFAAITHPADVFVWAKQSKSKGRWDVEVWYDGGRTRFKKRGVAGFSFDGKGGVAWAI